MIQTLRTKNLQPFRVMDIVRKAQQYPDAIHFEIGQPDLPPSPHVKQALHDAINAGRFAYTESLGLLALREKIATHYHREYNVSVNPEHIVIVPGTSTAFLIAYLVTLDSGSVLGLADPSYPCYKNFAHMVDVRPHFFPIGPQDAYQLTPEHLRGTHLNALHISSPANPTGTVYTRENMRALVTYCRAEGITLVSDELYHGLVYDAPAASALEFGDQAIVINGFSKYFTMPGLRLGWMILPEALVRPAEIIAQNLYISAPTLSQYAALEAFDYDYLARVRAIFRQRRDYLFDALSPLFPIDARPDGAFYLWADVSAYTDDAVAFADAMLAGCRVATTPGIDFGSNGTQHYLRFSYTREIAHMAEGIARLRVWLREHARA